VDYCLPSAWNVSVDHRCSWGRRGVATPIPNRMERRRQSKKIRVRDDSDPVVQWVRVITGSSVERGEERTTKGEDPACWGS
jgi:hypothetical protein